jgi:transcriptional regulator with XRE-family HTH domain
VSTDFNAAINEAVAKRMKELARERHVTLNTIITKGNINQSTISEIMRGNSKHPRLSTIYKFCVGCGITLSDFFDSEYFREL